MDEEHPARAARTERGEEARGPPRDVHWGAVAGALLLGLRALLGTRRRGRSGGRRQVKAPRSPGDYMGK